MWPANKILTVLNQREGSLTTQEIADLTGLKQHQVVNSTDVLVKNKLAYRVERGVFTITLAGRSAIAVGTECKSGPRGAVGHRALRRISFRQRLWNALRIEQKGTQGHIVSLILQEDEREETALAGAKKYFSILCQAGYLAKLPGRAQGTAPTSNGYQRYLLVENTGPLAPRLCTDPRYLYDPNTGQTVALKRGAP